MNYCNGVEGFINYASSKPKILVDVVLYVHIRGVKIKSFSIQMLLRCAFYKKKKFIEKYLCWFAHIEPYVLYETMVEMIIESIFNFSNVHGVVDNNSNCYKSMETSKHLFIHCNFSRSVWMKVLDWWSIQCCLPKTLDLLLLQWPENYARQISKINLETNFQ